MHSPRLNERNIPYYVNYNLADNGTHRWIYIAYEHSTLEITIIPEFPSNIILTLLATTTLLTAIFHKKHTNTTPPKKPKESETTQPITLIFGL